MWTAHIERGRSGRHRTGIGQSRTGPRGRTTLAIAAAIVVGASLAPAGAMASAASGRGALGSDAATSTRAPAALTSASPALTSASPAINTPPTAIQRDEFLTRRQVRSALNFTRPLATYIVMPTDPHPITDPDCATAERPEATSAVVYPAARTRTQFFEYDVPGRPWTIQGRVLVLEYASRAQARSAMARAVASVRSTSNYELVCEAINPTVSQQRPARSPNVEGRSFAWRYHLKAINAGSYRDVISTKGKRLVWVELGRVQRAELDWGRGTPTTDFPRYPSPAYLRALATPAIAKAL